MKINILSERVSNQIAAGEVVERPASVVKELVENALDAGATEVTVGIVDGGRALVQLIDNGRGMGSDDAKLSIQRFATSKFMEVSDFDSLSTFGFRGEALPSIASVSKLTLETSDGQNTTKIITSGGNLISEIVTEGGTITGTTIEVRDLFFNVPARRSFLKGERSEIALIKAVLSDFAVSRPKVRLTLIINGEVSLILPTRDSLDSFTSFYGRVQDLRLTSAELMQCSADQDTPSGRYFIQAALTKPLDCVSGSGKLRTIVNGRAVRDKILIRAVRDAYGTFLKGDKFPVGVVKLEVPPQDIEVNVHPQKAEIRFRAPDRVFSVTRQAIGAALRGVSTASRFEDGNNGSDSQVTTFSFDEREVVSNSSPIGFNFEQPGFVSAPNIGSKDGGIGSSRYLGEIFNCYLLFEKLPDSFVIVDMHAAHERITYAKIKRSWSEGEVVTQKLLLPEVVYIPSHLQGEDDDFLEILESLGFEIERIHQSQFVVRGVPELLARVPTKDLFANLLSELSVQDLQGALERQVDAVINRVACHTAVRSGQKLSAEEAYQLVDDLDSIELRAFCPHGRSVARVMTRNDLEKLFGRVE